MWGACALRGGVRVRAWTDPRMSSGAERRAALPAAGRRTRWTAAENSPSESRWRYSPERIATILCGVRGEVWCEARCGVRGEVWCERRSVVCVVRIGVRGKVQARYTAF